MMPPAEQFAAVMSSLGVGDGTRVVCYDAAMNMWAARLWWMLRAFGFEDAAVLNGGWRKWKQEGHPVSDAPSAHPPGTLTPRPRPEMIATRDDVLAYVQGGGACVLNALAGEQHHGSGASPYARAGRIAGSTNVPAMALLDSDTHAYRPAGELRALFQAAGALDGKRVVTYCGGGIAASSDALALTLLGVEDVAVYDGSLSEWAADPSLPMEVG
jgi:thiosulfate/3-mercaptopyruvate sulfurtransferase